MEIQGGWIKAYRKMLDNPVCCKDSDYFSVWMYLLLNATHKEHSVIFKGKRVILKPGQLVTGRQVIAKKFKISESKVQRILADLETEQQIEQQTASRNRLITIFHWEDYQEVNNKMNSEWTANEQQNGQHFEQQNNSYNTGNKSDTDFLSNQNERQNEQQDLGKVNTYKNTINNSIYLNLNKKDFENVSSFKEFEELVKDLPYIEQVKAKSEYLAEKYRWKKY